MMAFYYTDIIYGVPNEVRYGTGLTSTEVEPKRVESVYLVVSGRQNNFIEMWLERERLGQVVDYIIPLTTDDYRLEIPIGVDIPVGRIFNIALRCGGTATVLYVVYKYSVSE